MSDFVEQINDGIKARLVAVLPATYKELDYVLDVGKNNFQNNELRYGVHPLSAETTPTVTKKVSLTQIFEIILSDFYVNKDDDTEQRAAIFRLYDKMDDIFKDLLGTKAGVPSIITLISEPSMDIPEYPEDGIAVLRGQVAILWRRSTS